MEQKKIKKIKDFKPPTQVYIQKNINSDININQQFIKNIIEKLNKFNEHKSKFIEQYLIFLKFHDNLLNNGIAKIEVRSITYRQNFKLDYGENIINQFNELHHIFGNRSSNKSEEIIALGPIIHKYYHSILDSINISYQNLIIKFKIIEDIEENINFIKLKYNDRKNIILLGQEVKELMEYIDISSKNYKNIDIIPDEIIEERLKSQINILLEQFYTSTNNGIIDDEINRLNFTIESLGREIENYIKKDNLENIMRNINNKYLSKDKNKSKKQDNILIIYEKIIKAINENKITKKDIEDVILIESIGCAKQLDQATCKSRINGINNKIKRLEEARINLNELLDYRDYLINRLDYFNKLKINKPFELASNIRMEKMDKISKINNNINNIIECRKENQRFFIDFMKSDELLNTLKEINNCFNDLTKQSKIKNIA